LILKILKLKQVKNKMKRTIGLLMLLSCFSAKTFSQENFYKIYQYETALVGHVEMSLWNTYIPNSDLTLDYFDNTLSRKNLFAHSLEAEYGLTDHLTLGAYADFLDPQHGSFNYVRTHFAARYRFFQRYDKFINTALYVEYYVPREAYSSSQEVEVRLILDKDLEDFRIVLNPMITKYTTGSKDKSIQPGVLGGVYYRRCKVQPGVEFYSNFKEKTAEIFPTLNIFLSPSIAWNIGAGFGLNNNSDNLIIKSVLQLDVQAFRPSNLFKKNRIN